MFAAAPACGLPILFHSGIFIDGRSGRFCRPTFFEAVRDYPTLRITLAHLGWPWCDEANAVGLIDRINGVDADDSQFRFDISFGPPPIYRARGPAPGARGAGAAATACSSGATASSPCGGAHIGF